MRTTLPSLDFHATFSSADIAQAARVPLARVLELLQNEQIVSFRGLVARRDAVRAVRILGGLTPATRAGRAPVNLMPDARRRTGVSLFASGAIHALMLVGILLIASMGFLDSTDTEQIIKDPTPVHLVFLMQPGPGGGGGGGGLRAPLPPARAERKAPVVKKVSSPGTAVRKDPPPPQPVVEAPPKPVEPPKPIEPPKVDPPKVDPPKPPPQTVQAPVAPVASDQTNKPGVLDQPPSPVASAGPGTGGGTGNGTGPGMGEGRGGGIGPGEGGGTGGGPYQPGAGIEPPVLLREVKPGYTDEARRRGIGGNVQLEIVVRRDGTVSNLRVVRGLGAGLDEKALEAVRQWRFAPAKRRGVPVDVVVQVSVEFAQR